MTDAPIWPGVTEYLYHAASPARRFRDGTWIVPSALTPRCSSLELTPMAGTVTDTGSERCSDSHRPFPADGPLAPAAAREGCGAWSCSLTATPTAAAPHMMRRTPDTPATRARRLPDAAGWGTYPLCGQEMTTRSPAMRRHSHPSVLPRPAAFRMAL